MPVQAIKKLRSDWSVIQQIEMWESQCHKPTIWGWFIAPRKMVILGMVYGIQFKFSTIWMSLKQLEDVGRCWKMLEDVGRTTFPAQFHSF